MRVERHAVGLFDTAQKLATLIAQGEEPAIGAIDVEPRAIAVAQLSDLGEWIDRTRVHGSGRSNDQPRRDTVAAILFQRLLQGLDRHAVPVVGRDDTLRTSAAAGDVERLVHAIMGEACDVDCSPAFCVPRFPRGDDAGEIGNASARRQRTRCICRITDDIREPRDAGIFDAHRAGTGRCEPRIFVRRRSEQIAECRKGNSASRDIRHETGAGGCEPRPVDARTDVVEHGSGIPALLRKFGIEPLAEDFRPGTVARRVLDLVPIGECVIHRLESDRATFIRVGFERRCGFAQPFDLGAKLVDHAIRRAASTAWYVSTPLAPARLKAMSVSRISASRSPAPAAAEASIIAYSPLT